MFPVDKWAQSGKEGTLRSSDRELDAAKRGAHNRASHNIRGEHSCAVLLVHYNVMEDELLFRYNVEFILLAS